MLWLFSMRGFCEIFDFFCLVLLRENHSDAAQSVDHPVDDVIEFDIVLDQHATTLGKVGFAFEQSLPACTPSSVLPNKPKLAAFINGSQKSIGL
jgi:hypothetical protein